jgi:hypothetical protein
MLAISTEMLPLSYFKLLFWLIDLILLDCDSLLFLLFGIGFVGLCYWLMPSDQHIHIGLASVNISWLPLLCLVGLAWPCCHWLGSDLVLSMLDFCTSNLLLRF